MGVCRVCSFYFKQKTAYDMRISDWSSDVCSSDLSPVMRSAVAAFGFVYIHPLADGNGRVHRFLVNAILRRDGAVPEPVILPVSAVIIDASGERRHYDRADRTSVGYDKSVAVSVGFGSRRLIKKENNKLHFTNNKRSILQN